MEQYIKAIIIGFVIAVVIVFFLPSSVSFLAFFLASIIAVYVFGIRETKDGVLVAFGIYVFVEWILGSFALIGLLLLHETLSYAVDEWVVLSQIYTTLFVLLGGIIGPELVRRTPQRATTLPPRTVPVPPPSTLPVPTSPVPVATSEERKFCRYCGAQRKTDAVFCEKCGKKIG